MSGEDFDLGRVVSPVGIEDFIANYWEQKPLLVQREDPEYFSSLLSIADVDEMICSRDLRTPALRLVKKGVQIPLSSYTSNVPWGGDVFTNVVNVDKVFAEYQQGATIVLQALHRSHRPLGLFCRDLERQLNCPLQTNIYLTPPSAQGFAAHYDTHDVFVLQVAGEKHWLVYNSPVPLPDKNTPYKKETTPTPELQFEVDLKAGDLLYLPRGYMHEALTSDSESLHITVGVVVYTWGDLFAEALAQLQSSQPAFRRSLPTGLLNHPEVAAEMGVEFSALVQLLEQETKLDKAVNRIADRFLNSRIQLPHGRLTDLTEINTITIDTDFKVRPGIISRLTVSGGQSILTYEGKTIRLPDYVEPLLSFMLQHGQFKGSDLPPTLDAAGKLVLVRRLVKEGFLNIDRPQ